MANLSQVQYIQFYTQGSAARKLEVAAPVQPKKAPVKSRKPKKQVIYVDPVAFLGIKVAFSIMLSLLIGVFQLTGARTQTQMLENRVQQLQQEQVELSAVYESGYDLEAVEKAALEMGLVPASQAQRVQIEAQVPELDPQEPGAVSQMLTALVDLFA